MLRSLRLKAVYQSDQDDLLRDFYLPALATSISYDRAVGYFSAAMFSYAAQGLSAFVGNGGRMRLVVGGELDHQDVRAIEEGYATRELAERLGRRMVETIDAVDDSLFQRRLELLAWLVASGRLDIKLALKRRGMFHAKIGIMKDANDDRIVFQGSANETAYALLPDFNFESVNVFPTWRPEFREHFQPHIDTFDRLWANKSKDTLVIDFPDAVRERLVRIAKTVRLATPELELSIWEEALQRLMPTDGGVSLPHLPVSLNGQSFEIKEHQRRALQAWRAADAQGILALATGAGKTVTAIYGAVRIFEQMRRLSLVIAVPYQSLADQWMEVLRLFGINAFACYGGLQLWHDQVREAAHLFKAGTWPFFCCVVVNKTLCSKPFQDILGELPGDNLMWVGDECHHHGAAGIAAALPLQARLRLGLSATPENYLNSTANDRLATYYGKVNYTYDLAQALGDKILTPYHYHVHFVDLTERETEEYERLSREIRQQFGRSGGQVGVEGGNPGLDYLLFQRARLLGAAANKLRLLDELLGKRQPASHTLFYCSDGLVDDESDDDDDSDSAQLRQVEAVTSLLYRHGWRASTFTAREGRSERAAALDGFRVGDIDALVAIRCLDEGIDVPACREAYLLASSRNPRQFIQRRGRILRRSTAKELASIVDLLVRIPTGASEDFDIERKLIAMELERVAEFARLARNAGEVVQALAPVLRNYGLEHVLV